MMHESNPELKAFHMTGSGDIIKAICKVMEAVDWVHQTGKTPQYGYLSETDLALALQGPMQENGLCLLPHESRPTVSLHREGTGGKAALYRTDLVQTYWLCHEAGTAIPIQVAGCGVDAHDKGIYQALTGAYKYALRQMFLIPSGDDAEKPPTGAERVEESRRLLAELTQTHPADLKAKLRDCWPQLVPADQKAATVLRDKAEKELRAAAQARREK
jgi:hypothetical protein